MAYYLEICEALVIRQQLHARAWFLRRYGSLSEDNFVDPCHCMDNSDEGKGRANPLLGSFALWHHCLSL